jgi:tetratricopeptide (TPR) repeat protein
MQNVFTDYPEVPWKQGWPFFSGPEDRTPFITGADSGALTAPGGEWTLQLIEPTAACTTRLLCNGFSISARKRPKQNRIDALITEPGLLCGKISGLPMPQLNANGIITKENGFAWVQSGHTVTLFLQRNRRFALVCGELTPERALGKAEASLEENFDALAQSETEERRNVSRLFSINPRHNPPVALAAENLTARLRERNGALHGIWSLADGFANETFSLNELYPLVRAWSLIDPPVALELVQTALSLQQSSGGFPAWAEAGGLTSTTAPWPFIAQSFELAWQSERDPTVLRNYLPALRKYVQWAVRRFDPHRDRIPAWQNEQEVFVPGSFARGKATPEIAVLLIAEIEAVMRLCEENEHTGTAAASLIEERDYLTRTLNTVFWNPTGKAFSNAWKDGHYLHEPSFGSFMPLFWRGLDREKQTALLENFEETHGFPGHQKPSSWKQEEIDDTAHLPAIHQLMTFEALRNADSGRALLILFVRRVREGFAAWFERESIEAARGETNSASAYTLGPVTAALILIAQSEFEREAAKAPSTARQILRWGHRRKINKTDLRIIAGALLAILLVHLVYTLPHNRNTDARIAEAALSYQQGRYAESMRICRRYPDSALSRFLQANLLMLAEHPDQAETLYRKALTQETESPSALLGLALALQMKGNLKEAEKRYIDFIDIYETMYPEAAELADEFMLLTREKFSRPPNWRRVYILPMMNDLGL